MMILITGAAGFIVFNLANFLLYKSNHIITGIDNLNHYYFETSSKEAMQGAHITKKFNFLT